MDPDFIVLPASYTLASESLLPPSNMGLGHTLLVVATAIPLAVGAAVAGREYGTAPVCIVGAGPSGLTAAKALENKGREVVIFEKRPDVGGKCQSHYKE